MNLAEESGVFCRTQAIRERKLQGSNIASDGFVRLLTKIQALRGIQRFGGNVMNLVPGKLAQAATDRRGKRDRVLLSARLLTRAGETTAQLSDISSGGCSAYCAAPLSVGDHVTFARGHLVIRAWVTWAQAGRVGFQFAKLIDVAELRAGRPTY